MKYFHFTFEVSKVVKEDGAGYGACRDCNDVPHSPRSTDGPRFDGSLLVPPVVTHLAVALYILNTKAGVTEVQDVIEFLMYEEFDLFDFSFYLHNIDQCVLISEDVAKQAVSKYCRLQDK